MVDRRRRARLVRLALVAALACGAPRAHAATPLWRPLDVPGLRALDAGQIAAPALADLDGDGDLDLALGADAGGVAWYRNTGDSQAPAFVEVWGSESPFFDVATNALSHPAFADLDGDGDLDLLVADFGGHLATYWNTGSATLPAFVAAGTDGPLAGESFGGAFAPALGSVTGGTTPDAQPDLLVGLVDGTFRFWQNLGAAPPSFTESSVEPFTHTGPAFDVGDYGRAAIADLDTDGDADVVAGSLYEQNLVVWKQTTDAPVPSFSQVNTVSLPDPDRGAIPALGDLDGDGYPDLVAGAFDGTLAFRKNSGLPGFITFYATSGGVFASGESLGTHAVPALGDLDGDGDLDLVAGGEQVRVYYRTSGPGIDFQRQSGNGLDGLGSGGTFLPVALGDIDADGDLDLVLGTLTSFEWYRNTGSTSSPSFLLTTRPFPSLSIGNHLPAIGDLDGDGVPEVAYANWGTDTIGVLRNTGSASAPAYAEATGSTTFPATGLTLTGFALVDLDGDGDLDAVLGLRDGTMRVLRNSGSTSAPAFVLESGNVYEPVRQLGAAAPALGDLDGDGDLDLVLGNARGVLHVAEASQEEVFATGFEADDASFDAASPSLP